MPKLNDMTGILEYIKRRRSIRKYRDEPVPRDLLEQLLQAAMAAPSASNKRPWEFVVVTESSRLAALRRGLVLGRYTAPAAIIVCGNMRRTYPKPARDFWIEDCSAASQNILLAASGLGLGAIWIGVYPLRLFMAHVSRVLGLPRHVHPLGVIHVGFPAESKPARTQYEQRRVHWQQW